MCQAISEGRLYVCIPCSQLLNIKTQNSFFFLFGSLQPFLDLDNKVAKIFGVWISNIYLQIRDSPYVKSRK